MGPDYRVGIISDSHGVVPAGVAEALAGVDHILHAGDLESLQALVELEMIAPIIAVRGNCDAEGATAKLPVTANVVLGGVRFVVAHRERDALRALDASSMPVDVVVTGHTHVFLIEDVDGVLRVNPGSTTYPREDSHASVAVVTIADDRVVSAEIVRVTEEAAVTEDPT